MPNDERQRPNADAPEDDDAQDAGPPADDDPLRVIRLMWEPPAPPRRGPRPKISLASVVEAGVRVADARGLDGLSMRVVASELGVGAMSLYTYVRSKTDLIEMMVDAVFAERRPVDPEATWRDRLRSMAEDDWAIYHRHPWLLETNLWRASWGPNVLDATEALYAALGAAGLAPRRIVEMSFVYEAFVQGAARNSVVDAASERETGLGLTDYMTSRLGFFETLFDSERFPMHVAIYQAGGFDEVESTFELALAVLFEAVERLREDAV